ncbi:RNase III domain-containing protein [Caenorhabditis elegans]|uniref:RNase III domain-containing protein n=1 Tax=Caenorhabditis elegans TaxID=6239 RepID=O62354_CAEEL|nr:RNase III domain-containing protein [Caenorhabditis elegans]CAB04669.2 RNase III domain-containing protein [Caenorhabditis elegans]|eukprot:NP_493001.2 Uncharacterized protein CELE_T02G6.4 [Caenorhabditis elegans]
MTMDKLNAVGATCFDELDDTIDGILYIAQIAENCETISAEDHERQSHLQAHRLELHLFGDASAAACGAVAYLRRVDYNNYSNALKIAWRTGQDLIFLELFFSFMALKYLLWLEHKYSEAQ